jgi:hypothetical protein
VDEWSQMDPPTDWRIVSEHPINTPWSQFSSRRIDFCFQEEQLQSLARSYQQGITELLHIRSEICDHNRRLFNPSVLHPRSIGTKKRCAGIGLKEVMKNPSNLKFKR